jgi:hypothetical protein
MQGSGLIKILPFAVEVVALHVDYEQSAGDRNAPVQAQWRVNTRAAWSPLAGNEVPATPPVSVEFLFIRPDYQPIVLTHEVRLGDSKLNVTGPRLTAWQPTDPLRWLERARKGDRLDDLFIGNPPKQENFSWPPNAEEYKQRYAQWVQKRSADVAGKLAPLESKVTDFRVALFQYADPATLALRRDTDLAEVLASKGLLPELPAGLVAHLGTTGAEYQRLAAWRKHWQTLVNAAGRAQLAADLAALASSVQATSVTQADLCRYESTLLIWDPASGRPDIRRLPQWPEVSCWMAHAKFRDTDVLAMDDSLQELSRYIQAGGRANAADALLAAWCAHGMLENYVVGVEEQTKPGSFIVEKEKKEFSPEMVYYYVAREHRAKAGAVAQRLVVVLKTLPEVSRPRVVARMIKDAPWAAELVRERLHWPMPEATAEAKRLGILRDLLKAGPIPLSAGLGK